MRTAPLALVWLIAAVFPALANADAGLVFPAPASRMIDAADRLTQAVDRPLKRFEKEEGADRVKFILICDFNPTERANASDNFGACYELAKRLRDLQTRGVQTVAFVHGEVTRHSVLPVLACSEVVLSKDPPAKLGKVVDQGRPLDAAEKSAYDLIARNRYPLAIVRKMYDRDLAVVKVRNPRNADRYRDANEKPRPEGDLVGDLRPGETAAFTFAKAHEYGLCLREPRDAIDQVLQAYHLPRTALIQAPELPIVWRMVLAGTLTSEMREKVMRHVRRALGQKANVLIFQLECGDGDGGPARELANDLAHLNDNRPDNPIETVAFVTPEARNTAAFIAFGCDRIIMHSRAHLGDFERFIQGHRRLEPILRRNLEDTAARMHYPAVLARGMLDRDLCIVEAVSARGDGERLFLDDAQFREENREAGDKGPRWRALRVVKPLREEEAGKYLTLDAPAARGLGVSSAVADTADDVYTLVGAEPRDVRTADSDMLDQLAEFLRNPWTKLVLIMVGITCLILELKVPGASLPGVLAAVCFLLFFWSHLQGQGQWTTMMALAVGLFLLGLVLIGMEVFILPGFMVFGISGILLVLGGLGLMAYGHWPQSSEDWAGLGRAIAPITLSMVAAMALAFLVARYLPNIPIANRLLLKPQVEDDAELGEAGAAGIPSELASLLGAIGVALTPLRPAGKTQFGDAFIDVIAEGSYVPPGARVQVIEIEGNRVVVKEV